MRETMKSRGKTLFLLSEPGTSSTGDIKRFPHVSALVAYSGLELSKRPVSLKGRATSI